MQYPNILSLIDAELDRLQRARKLLLSAPLIDIPTFSVRQKTLRRARVRVPVRSEDLLTAATTETLLPDKTADSSEDPAGPGVTPPAVFVALPQPTVVIVKKRLEPKRLIRVKKHLPGEPSALRSAAPALPVAVSAMEAQRQRAHIQEMRGTGAGKAAQVPELSAEALAQRWLRKGQADTQSA